VAQLARRLADAFRFRVAVIRNRPDLPIELHAQNGLFAQLNWCLYICKYCEERGLRPRLRLTGPNYGDVAGEDWLSPFVRIGTETAVDRERRYLRMTHISELGIAGTYRRLTLAEGHRLFSRHFEIRKPVIDHATAFWNGEFGDRPVLGVHFRGTDKHSEAPTVPFDTVMAEIDRALTDQADLKDVFLASDEQRFIERATAALAARGIRATSHPDIVRSTDGKAAFVHQLPGRNAAKIHDALVNCILLSRSTVLLRSASFLSGWASVLNPRLRVRMLNAPYAATTWFPDREVLKIAERVVRA
jgi:hypothetical protein